MPTGIDVYDDVLSAEQLELVQQQITDRNFPWYWNANTYGVPVTAEDDDRVFEADQFGHIFFQYGDGVNSDWFGLVETVLIPVGRQRGCDFDLLRAKANLLMPSLGQGEFNTPHQDLVEPHLVVLFYVLDSDGDTVFFSNNTAPWQELHRVKPRANRAVVFDGAIYHASRHPRQHNRRIVMNCNVREVVSGHLLTAPAI